MSRNFNLSRFSSSAKRKSVTDEEQFLAAVRAGDLKSMKRILKTKEINEKCYYYQSLDIAVDNEDIDVIEFLLDNLKVNEKHYYCAILRAIFNDNAFIVERLLDKAEDDKACFSKLRELMSGNRKCTDCVPDFAVTNLTPTMAATVKGNVEITQLLVERGFTIKNPVSHKCSCPEANAETEREEETLTESINRMNVYRTLASPTYLLVTSEDPILEAFEMSCDTKRLSMELPENQKEYLELSTQCSKFATDILNQCRNTNEVQMVLTRREGFKDQRPLKFSRVRFFMLLFIIMLAFATGLNSIYKNYRGSPKSDVDEDLQQPTDFLTLKATFKSLFWAIFGMGEPDFAQIIVTVQENGTEFKRSDEHFFTEGVGYTLWGMYHLVTVVILLNMVIAMMTESYQRVQTNADMEWKFACSTLWLTVFDPHCVVPPPFNLIPSMHRVARFFQWTVAYFRDQRTDISWSCSGCICCRSEVDSSSKIIEDEEYKELMAQLSRRYLHWKHQQSKESSLANTADMKEKLKEEILQELYKKIKRENYCISVR